MTGQNVVVDCKNAPSENFYELLADTFDLVGGS